MLKTIAKLLRGKQMAGGKPMQKPAPHPKPASKLKSEALKSKSPDGEPSHPRRRRTDNASHQPESEQHSDYPTMTPEGKPPRAIKLTANQP